LAIINTAFYQPKKVGPNGVWVLSLFSTIALDLQRSLFVITTTKNVKLAMHKPFDVNPITKLWRTLTSFQMLENKVPKYIKLVELIGVQIIGSIENKH
jgi:hypothetical protein